MIKELHLRDWKSFGNATLYIDQLTFVIGTNASGKSNILDALSFLHAVSSGMPIENVLKDCVRGGQDWVVRRGCKSFSLTVVAEHDGTDYEYDISCEMSERNGVQLKSERLEKRGSGNKSSKVLFITDDAPDTFSSVIPTRFYTARPGRQRRLDLSRRVSVLSQYEILSVVKEVRETCLLLVRDMRGIFVFNPIPNHMRTYSALSDTLAEDGGNIAGVLAGMPEETQKKLEDMLSAYVRPLPEKDINRVWAEKVGRFGNDAMLYCEEQWHDGNRDIMDARSMSDGTLRFVAIVTALLTGRPGSLMVIEEIDNGLHPSRAGELVKVLRELGQKRNIDVLCTTHNPVLIDSLGVEMLPFISFVYRSKNDGTSLVEPVEDSRNLIKLMSSYSVGELMTKNKLGA